jgi:uncharacterized heparinase superfamily protein
MLKASFYFHTLRYSRPVQIYGRLWHKFYRPKPDLRPSPCIRHGSSAWTPPARKPQSFFSPDKFKFLNQEHDILSPSDWNRSDWAKLWLYNLHYFDDLNADGSVERLDQQASLIKRWIAENPPGSGNGWEPYPTSLRIVNWIKWALSNGSMQPEFRNSLAVQVRWLSRRLERHILGNHLFVNAKALVFAGLFFNGKEAEQWLATGLDILESQLPEQILKDGGQFELSPMYHALALEDLLDLYNIAKTFHEAIPAKWSEMIDSWQCVAGHMRSWLGAMCHPDGEISFFNDAAFGIAPPPAELNSYAGRLGFPGLLPPKEGLIHLKDSGYICIRKEPMVALLDVAPVAPDYLTAHGHADTLSFELSLFGERVIVNSGTSLYSPGDERLRERGTQAHNTVMINGKNSSEVWSSFRVARRAYPDLLAIEDNNDRIMVKASHNGYLRLHGRNMHHREWIWRTGSLTIIDEVSGPWDKAEARYHFHPDIKFEDGLTENNHVSLLLGREKKLEIAVNNAEVYLEKDFWHPCFGTSIATTCLVAVFKSCCVTTTISWRNNN